MQNGASKRQRHTCRGRALNRLAAAVRRGMAAPLVFLLCFFMVSAPVLEAAERGRVRHVDTEDYCLRAGDVTVKMSELSGLYEEHKQALAEKTSADAFYTWERVYEIWGDPVSGQGDFSTVNWDEAGSYTVTVRMPALTEGVVSEITYTLTIVDDLPPEPVPPMYRITVRYLEEETGEALQDDYVSDGMEEGTVPEIGEEILLAPEGWSAVEILGDLEGEMTSDRDILVICRKKESGPEESAEPAKEEEDPPERPEEADGAGSGHNSGKNSGKDSGKNSGKTSGRDSSGKKKSPSSSAGRTGTGQAGAPPAGPPGEEEESPGEDLSDGEEQSRQDPIPEETGPAAEEPLPADEEEIIKDAETTAGEEEPAPVREETASLTAPEKEERGVGLPAPGGALITQAEVRKERYPLWSMALAIGEGGILAVLGYRIFSDLKLILWFENKKRR